MKTLQSILDEEFEMEDNSKRLNDMHNELGTSIMFLINDLMGFEDGIRIRDRFSHGNSMTLR